VDTLLPFPDGRRFDEERTTALANPSHPLIAYWLRFSCRFVAELQQAALADLQRAWQGGLPDRTNLYRQFMPRIATALDLELEPHEFLRVDWVMSSRASIGKAVPVIFIESENNARSAYEEMRKLCAVSSPLAVLITVKKWDPKLFGLRARRKRLTEQWTRIIKAHAEVWARPGLIGVLVGEWAEGIDYHLRFYSFAFSTDGTICWPESTVFDMHLPSGATP
jgi:hypothetical protein